MLGFLRACYSAALIMPTQSTNRTFLFVKLPTTVPVLIWSIEIGTPTCFSSERVQKANDFARVSAIQPHKKVKPVWFGNHILKKKILNSSL